MARIDAFLELAHEQGASDLHFISGMVPYIRYNGELLPINFRTLTAHDGKQFLYEILNQEQKRKFEENLELDFSYHLEGISHFRVNMFHQREGIGAVFRLIPARILSIEELGLPLTLKRFARLTRGLVLVTGPTGSGKSTTLAAIIDLINSEKNYHILTIEDPIEFVYKPKRSIITQREVHTHSNSFAAALRAAVREAPDVLLVGEMRDLETISLALTCAETGILVFATLHTSGAASTVDRIIDVFPHEEQEQIKTMLSITLQGVVSQQLLKRADGKGRVAAVEVLTGCHALSNIIREGKTHQVNTLMQSSDYATTGMQTLDEALMKLVRERKITAISAMEKANNKSLFKQMVLEEKKRMEIYMPG